jgi:hypothetical protein
VTEEAVFVNVPLCFVSPDHGVVIGAGLHAVLTSAMADRFNHVHGEDVVSAAGADSGASCSAASGGVNLNAMTRFNELDGCKHFSFNNPSADGLNRTKSRER